MIRTGLPHIVIAGPTGTGKTTVASALAAEYGWVYLEGDDLHPPGNVEKMRSGQPLTDADREPWLRAIRFELDRRAAVGERVVVACSALRKPYRDLLRAGEVGAYIVQLVSDETTLGQRLSAREHHYMPPSLVHSQVASLEVLDPEEYGVVISANAAVHEVMRRVEEALGFDAVIAG